MLLRESNLLSRLITDFDASKYKSEQINESFPNEKLFVVTASPWFAGIANYLVKGIVPTDLSS